MSNDKAAATYHDGEPFRDEARRTARESAATFSGDLPIVPPYVQQRVTVARIFAKYIAEADAVLDSPRAAILEALRAEVLDALDPIEDGDRHS